ncbi:hypothetical protein Fmac_012873 [Flemingia macrophylla]|uniref:Uncharacterized protein n=1 Tax=Flemingia macrophylla TaxID=520843 RepID=A0ABD1MRJ0_9FABA
MMEKLPEEERGEGLRFWMEGRFGKLKTIKRKYLNHSFKNNKSNGEKLVSHVGDFLFLPMPAFI